MPHLIQRVAVLGTGLIGGSFALGLRKFTPDIHVCGWDRAEVVGEAHTRGAIHEKYHGDLAPAIANADLVYIALPISATMDLFPEIAKHAARRALITDACSTKLRIIQGAAELFHPEAGAIFLGGHPMAGRELSGNAQADANLFRYATYALIGSSDETRDPRVLAFVKLLEKLGARALWLGAQ